MIASCSASRIAPARDDVRFPAYLGMQPPWAVAYAGTVHVQFDRVATA
ncbi:hypothetical protein HF577_25960 [Pseudonocardia xinjiangensis]|uniref:Uncharacterized protein n=1 Tax=Pseudonocardia xinjiangensis TaxID=75289 RepID=A0ABX1RJH0_9PSEU|nr:hypothetical protein [Pseudonocardia xinjiangensis]